MFSQIRGPLSIQFCVRPPGLVLLSLKAVSFACKDTSNLSSVAVETSLINTVDVCF